MGFPDEVFVTISSNSEIVRFLSVEQYSNESPYDHMIPIGELINCYNLKLLPSAKKFTGTSAKKEECIYLTSFYQMIYHKLKFIEFEVFEERERRRLKMKDFADFIIDFLKKWPPTDDNMIISVKIEELKEYLTKDPDTIANLLAKHNFYLSLINSVKNPFSTKMQIEDELRNVLGVISQNIDERTSFFPIHALQPKFESLFMSPLLSYSTRFKEVVSSFQTLDSQLFLKTLFSIIPPFLNELGINRKPYDSALVLLLIRFSFDLIYEQNALLKNSDEDLLHDLVNIKFSQLNPPEEFSPKVEDRNTRIIDVFAYDEHFGVAIPPLQEMLFCTNPFDILDCVDRSLFCIEKAATVYNNYQTMVFPFEVTFELFMAVAIASQVSNWGNISVFVENYTPLSGLCPSFEFSKAKVVASAMQFQVMAAEMKGEVPNNDIDDKAKKATEYAASYSENIGDFISNGIVTLPEVSPSTQEEEENANNDNNQNEITDEKEEENVNNNNNQNEITDENEEENVNNDNNQNEITNEEEENANNDNNQNEITDENEEENVNNNNNQNEITNDEEEENANNDNNQNEITNEEEENANNDNNQNEITNENENKENGNNNNDKNEIINENNNDNDQNEAVNKNENDRNALNENVNDDHETDNNNDGQTENTNADSKNNKGENRDLNEVETTNEEVPE